MSERNDVPAEILRMSQLLNAPNDVESQLELLVQMASASMPEIDHAGISVAYRDGRLETRAATSELVRELDRLQNSPGEGPCLCARSRTIPWSRWRTRGRNTAGPSRWMQVADLVSSLGHDETVGLRRHGRGRRSRDHGGAHSSCHEAAVRSRRSFTTARSSPVASKMARWRPAPVPRDSTCSKVSATNSRSPA
jgi:hypothetical protein